MQIWNNFAGAPPFADLKEIKKFTDRKTATIRIWTADERLGEALQEEMNIAEQDMLRAQQEMLSATKAAKPAKAARTAAPKAPAKPRATKDTTSTDNVPAPSQRAGTRMATVVALLERSGGATLEEIMAATAWQQHSVRGFISTLGSKQGYTVASTRREADKVVEVLVAGVRIDTVEECGVKQSKIAVTYRFSEPGLPMPIVMTQSYANSRVIRIPMVPQTIGDHIRKRRLGMKLLQREAAEQLGVDKASVFNWEANKGTPEIRFMPAIIRFLGYNPLPEATTLAGQLVRRRTALGMSRNEAAAEIGVDAGTLAKWERGKREPAGELLRRVDRFLGEGRMIRAVRASELNSTQYQVGTGSPLILRIASCAV